MRYNSAIAESGVRCPRLTLKSFSQFWQVLRRKACDLPVFRLLLLYCIPSGHNATSVASRPDGTSGLLFRQVRIYNGVFKMRYFLSLLILFSAGCGVYTFSGHGIAGIESIAVTPFENQTSEFGIREAITDELVSRLLTNRTLTIASQASADAVLNGTIISITDAPLSYDENEEASENKVTIVVQATLHKRGQSEPIWSGRLVADGNYPYQTGSPQEREIGIDKAVERLVQDLMNRLTSDW
ncbi:hypothetical protein K9N50_04730 [bacterium]|nr:hypothetical protein [bacterium]